MTRSICIYLEAQSYELRRRNQDNALVRGSVAMSRLTKLGRLDYREVSNLMLGSKLTLLFTLFDVSRQIDFVQ